MDLNHRRAFSLLLYQLSYNRIRYSAYKANCTLSSEPRIIDKSYYVTPFGVVLPAGCEPAIHHWHSLLRRTCMLSTTVAYQSCLSSSQPSFRFAKPFRSTYKLPTRSSRWYLGWESDPQAFAEVFETSLFTNFSTETHCSSFRAATACAGHSSTSNTM